MSDTMLWLVSLPIRRRLRYRAALFARDPDTDDATGEHDNVSLET